MLHTTAGFTSVFAPRHSKNLQLAYIAGMIVAGNILLVLSAKFQIALFPVPFTMQTFVLLALVPFFGLRLAMASLLLYLAEGALGLPVFAGGGGLAYMTGPTGGYLAGWILAILFLGQGAKYDLTRHFLPCLGLMLIANFIIYGAGIVWLVTGLLLPLEQALTAGFWPFLLPDSIKALAVALLSIALHKKIARKTGI